MHNAFDATPSLKGYLYQIRYALLMAIRDSREVDDLDDYTITIETIDDISRDNNGESEKLVQVKHHIKPGNITDRSPDIWSTIRVWCKQINSGKVAHQPIFVLLTTNSIAAKSLAEMLSDDFKIRDVESVKDEMLLIAQASGNKENTEAYEAFVALSESERERLVSAIYVVGDAPDMNLVGKDIKKSLRGFVSEKYMDAFTERLEGDWFMKVIAALLKQGPNEIPLGEVVSGIESLKKEYDDDNLPDQYQFENVDPFFDAEIKKHYITQLKLLEPTKRVIKNAVTNSVKARKQRMEWSRKGLLNPGELNTYDEKLYDEWDFHAGLEEMKPGSKIDIGTGIYAECQTKGLKPIRAQFKADYVARGSYHLLANKNKIGWHPDYLELSPIDEGEGENE
jgi:hypothetical protein